MNSVRANINDLEFVKKNKDYKINDIEYIQYKLEEITGYKFTQFNSDCECELATLNDLNFLKKWLEKNKSQLFWDKELQKVKLKR